MPHIFMLLGVPLLLTIAAVAVDLRSRRGYGLALLALTLTVLLCAKGFVAIDQAVQHGPTSEDFVFSALAVIWIGGSLALMFWLGALIEASVARQWWWLASLILTAALPGVALLVDVLFAPAAPDYSVLAARRDSELALVILLPTLTVLVYGVSRVMRPPHRRERAA